MKLLDAGLEFLSRYFQAADILAPSPWLKKGKHAVLTPREFWNLVYSGKGFQPTRQKDHSKGYEAARLMKEAGLRLKSFDRSCLDVSPRFSSRLLVKVECSLSLFDESLFTAMSNALFEFNPKWAVRFSIYEDLLKANAYVGSVIAKSNGEVFIESGMQ
ncbi:MAG: hypothetical protein ACKV19_21430 [Verrucomicrobiales bacterium]